MNSTIQLTVGKLAVLVIGILLSAGASARDVVAKCTVNVQDITCTPVDYPPLRSFTAYMDVPIGYGTDPMATLAFDEPVGNYIGVKCLVDVNVVPPGPHINVKGDVDCKGHHMGLYISVVKPVGAGSKQGRGEFQ